MFDCILLGRIGKSSSTTPPPKLPTKQYRNRRVYARYDLNHKRLVIANEQDILLVRNISRSGFCCEVPERALGRLSVNEVYSCKLRYLGETFQVKARVAWKGKSIAGFEFQNPSPRMHEFTNRLIRPMQVGISLRPVYLPVRLRSNPLDPLWFRGDLHTSLFMWRSMAGRVRKWAIHVEKRYIEWTDGILESGTLIEGDLGIDKPWARQHQRDSKTDPELRQFALDVFMTLAPEMGLPLLETFGDVPSLPTIPLN
jgi:hypothetical protein